MNDLRKQIEQEIGEGRYAEAKALVDRLWRESPGSATAGYLVQCGARLRGHIPLAPARVRILRSFTLEPAVPLFRAGALAGGIDLSVELSEFNAYAQEFLDPGSPLYTEPLTAVILAVSTRDLAPELWDGFADLSAAGTRSAVEHAIAQFRNWVTLFRASSQASLVIHTLEMPPFPSHGVLDAQARDRAEGEGQCAAIAQINDGLRSLAAATPGVYVLDFDALIARRGRDHWYDATKWFTVRMPMRAENLGLIAAEWLKFLHPITGKVAKVVVTDLDNTLWGGVVGEDGIQGIQVHRDEHKGAPYWNLQRALADLQQRGILLAIASKNNPEDALQAIDSHPGMLLRSRHFAATRIGWGDKASSLREIAAELNVGLDSLVFVDDNPVERQMVRMSAPEVTVLELPADPSGYARAVRECPLFERLALSNEDRERTGMYAAQAERRRLEQSASSIEDFYRSLAQQVEITRVTPANFPAVGPRVAQLTQKTNQFNLTTRRYNEAQILDLCGRPDWDVYAVSVRDRFGDNGLVGVCITRDEDSTRHIDSFLMSCRVIGRTVETAILSAVAAGAKARGLRRLEGWFLPTRKNAPSAGFFRQHGFSVARQEETGELWSLDLGSATVPCPEWIGLNVDEKETAHA